MGREVGQRSSEQHQPGVPLALVRHRRLSVTRRHREDVETMPVTSTQSVVAKMHLRDGAIYRDSSNNIIRLLSIHGDYCAYVYIALGDPRWEMHGSVTGVTRRNVFEADFVFVSECVEDWNGSQRKSSDGRIQALHIHPPSVASVSEPQKRSA
jgi:hypothetical protein